MTGYICVIYTVTLADRNIVSFLVPLSHVTGWAFGTYLQIQFGEQRTCCMCNREGIANIKHWQYSLVLFSVSPLINEPLTNCNNVYDWMLLHRRRTIQKEYNIIYVHKDIEMNIPCSKGSHVLKTIFRFCDRSVSMVCKKSLKISKGNQNLQIEGQKTQRQKEKGQNDKQWSTNHIHKTKDRVTRPLLKTGRIRNSCSTSGTRRVNIVTNPLIIHFGRTVVFFFRCSHLFCINFIGRSSWRVTFHNYIYISYKWRRFKSGTRERRVHHW